MPLKKKKKKQLGPIIFLNPHPHTSPKTWSNSFKPTPFRWVTTYYCLYILLTFCFFFSFFHFLFSLFPLWEETQRRLRRKNKVALHHRFASKITMVNWFLSFFPFIVYCHAIVIAQTLIQCHATVFLIPSTNLIEILFFHCMFWFRQL